MNILLLLSLALAANSVQDSTFYPIALIIIIFIALYFLFKGGGKGPRKMP